MRNRLVPLLPLALVLAGCSSEPGQVAAVAIQPEEALLKSVAEIREATEAQTLVIYDLSTPVLSEDATYVDGINETGFTVVVACPAYGVDGNSIQPIGVVPATGVTEGIEEAARSGQYQSLMAECEDGFTPITG